MSTATDAAGGNATPQAPALAVIGAPALAMAFADCGFRVVTDPVFQACALAVNKERATNAALPIIADLSHEDAAGFDAYLRSVASATRTVIVATRPDSKYARADAIPGSVMVPAPATVGAVMLAVGYQPAAIPQTAVIIEAESGAAAVPVPVPVPVPLPVATPAAESVEVPAVEVAAEQVDAEAAEREAAAAARDAALAAQVEAANAAAVAATADPTPAAPVAETPAGDARADYVPNPSDGDLPDFLLDELATTSAAAPVPVPTPTTASPVPTAPVAPVAPAWEPAAAPTPVPPSAFAAPTPAGPAPDGWGAVPAPAPTQVPAPAAVPADSWGVPPVSAPPAADTWGAAPAVSSPAAPVPVAVPAHNLYAAPAAHLPAMGRQGVLIVVIAGSGGVGKTSTSLDLADLAAEAGLKAVVIDANKGQPDVHKRMRIPEGFLPTIYDTVVTGMPSNSLLAPARYNPYRADATGNNLGFGLIAGPPSQFADETPASAYGQAIDYARANADVVIVDTQILEATQSDLFADVLIPRLRTDGWLVGVYGPAATSEDNIFERLGELVERDGVPRNRVFVVARNFLQFTESAREQVEHRIGANGKFAGVVLRDETYFSQMNLGTFRTDLPAIRLTVRSVLYAITGRPEFAPEPSRRAKGTPGSGWSLRRWIGSK